MDPQEEDIKNQAEEIVTITNLVQTYMGAAARLKNELLENKEVLEDTFANDARYMEVNEKVKSAAKEKKQIKAELLKNPQALALSQKIKDLSQELKEAQQMLSGYLGDYQRLTAATEIEDAEGHLMRIITLTKLVRSK
jgi:predicted nuclease with TOPRIM domain